MKWALVATTEQQLMTCTAELGWHYVIVQPGTVVNTIVYDGVTEYMPPEGTRLKQVPDEAQIGDSGY